MFLRNSKHLSTYCIIIKSKSNQNTISASVCSMCACAIEGIGLCGLIAVWGQPWECHPLLAPSNFEPNSILYIFAGLAKHLI